MVKSPGLFFVHQFVPWHTPSKYHTVLYGQDASGGLKPAACGKRGGGGPCHIPPHYLDYYLPIIWTGGRGLPYSAPLSGLLSAYYLDWWAWLAIFRPIIWTIICLLSGLVGVACHIPPHYLDYYLPIIWTGGRGLPYSAPLSGLLSAYYLDCVHCWCNKWGMTVNIDKNKVIHFKFCIFCKTFDLCTVLTKMNTCLSF